MPSHLRDPKVRMIPLWHVTMPASIYFNHTNPLSVGGRDALCARVFPRVISSGYSMAEPPPWIPRCPPQTRTGNPRINNPMHCQLC